jgi:ParB-like nuclease family protein
MNTAPTVAKSIPLDEIEPVFRRARDVAAFAGLKASLKSSGQKVPIQVEDVGRKNDKGIRYKLICGQGRTEAARALGWTHIDAIVREGVTAEEFTGIFFNENVNRQNLPWAAKGRIIRDEVKRLQAEDKRGQVVRTRKQQMAAICAELNISVDLGQRYLNVLDGAAQGLEKDIESMGMNVAERLTKLPAKGQLIVMAVAKETQQDVTAVVRKAEKLEAKGEGWTQAQLQKAIRSTKDTVAKQRETLKVLRLNYSLGPQNLMRLARDKKFHAAMVAARLNLQALEALE